MVRMADERDYYEVLGLKKGASDDEIKKAFKKTGGLYIIKPETDRRNRIYDDVKRHWN